MANANDRSEVIRQNLLDSGLDEQAAAKCMKIAENSDLTQILPVLETQRTKLLNGVRAGQKQIDCLDYLVYQIKQKNRRDFYERKI